MRPFQPCRWPRPRSWLEIYAVIVTMLLAFLAAAYALAWLRGVL